MALKVGAKAPDFELKNSQGETVKLSTELPCVVYFYPKDFTQGCTEEACSFRDSHNVFSDLNISVFGISRDSTVSHKKFRAKHDLPFELLSDSTGKVCKAYDALVPIIKVPKRITYLIDDQQRIKAAFSDMFAAKKHIQKMIQELNT